MNQLFWFIDLYSSSNSDGSVQKGTLRPNEKRCGLIKCQESILNDSKWILPFLPFFNSRFLKAVPIRRNNFQNVVFFLVSPDLPPVHRHFIQGEFALRQAEAERDAICMSPRSLFDPGGAFHFCRIFGVIDKAVLR